MPEDDISLGKEVDTSDKKTSFLETSLKIIKHGVLAVGAVWAAAGVGKVAIDIAYGGEVDTTFLEQAWTSLTPVFTGFISALIGFFIGSQTK